MTGEDVWFGDGPEGDPAYLATLLRAALRQSRLVVRSLLSPDGRRPSGMATLGLLYATVGVRMMACAGERLDDGAWSNDSLCVIAPEWLTLWQYFGRACVVCGRVFGVDEVLPVVGRVPVEAGTRPVRSCASCEQLARWLVPRWVRPPEVSPDEDAGPR